MIFIPRVGWLDVRPSQWPVGRVRKPDPEPVHVDPEQERARVAELVRARHERENPPYEPWPEPEVRMRTVEGADVPDAPARLARRLQSAGWRVAVTYARGTWERARDGFTGKGADRRAKHYPGKVIGSYAVRASKPDRRAVAIWHEQAGRLSAHKVLVLGDGPARWIGIQEFERGL